MTEKITEPCAIEQRSFEIITEELGDRKLDPVQAPIIKRVIHTTADFGYADSLYFSENAIEQAVAAIRAGCTIFTDTNMVKAGINKKKLAQYGCKIECFIADTDVAEAAVARSCTRAQVAVEKAMEMEPTAIFVVGNAPTALEHIAMLTKEGRLSPRLVVGAPVGFVNILESKDAIRACSVPSIISLGRKGGSNVAAAIINALLLMV